MGRDRMDAAKLLQQHNVIVRGGPQDGKKLLDALVVSPLQVWMWPGPMHEHCKGHGVV